MTAAQSHNMKRLLIFFLLSTFLLKANLAFAYIETSENIKLDKVPTTKTLNLPDPARGWIDYSKWTCDNSAITITEMTASAYLSISKNFSGTAKVECVYVAKWYDSKGFTQSDTYLRTFYITYNSSAPEKLEVTITPNGGSVTRGTTVKFKCNSESATIYYTDDGSNPSKSSYKYIGEGYSISEPVTLKAIAYNGTQSSDIVSASFTIDESKIVKFKTIEGIEVTAVKYLSKGSYKLGLGEGAYTPCIDKSYKGKLTIPEKVNGMPVISITKHAFLNCKLTDIILPEGLTTIYTEAFSGCSLETITLPSTITTIANYSFEFCYLESIYCKDTTPGTIGTNAFSSITYRDAILYVPIGTQSLYRNKKGWSEFSKIREYDNSPKIYVSDISITPQSKTLKVGDTFTFSAVVSPENATDKSVTWKSSNTQIATVSDNGTVSAKSVGTAMITCTAKDGSGKSASCELKVTAQDVLVTSIQLNKTSDELDVGQTSQLTATVYPSNATNKAVTWTSSNSSVATVSTSGLVTAKGVGTATITCSAKDSGNAKATCTIKVTEKEVKVTRIELNKTSDELEVGKTTQLTATVYPSNATNKTVSWTSSNSSVAAVSTSGLVTAKGVGTATITCNAKDSGNAKATCTIKVKAKETQDSPDEFSYQGVNYVVLDREAGTCQTKPGTYSDGGSSVSGNLVIPATVSNGKDTFKVISIGFSSFRGNKELTSIELPSTVRIIGNNAFEFCENLSEVKLSDGLTTIGEEAFYFTNISSIVLPSTLIEIKRGAFAFSKLSDVFIPKSVSLIEPGAFLCTTFDYDKGIIKSIIVDSGNMNYTSTDGVLFDKAINTLHCFPAGKIQEKYIVPTTVRTIEDRSFQASQISSVVLPNTATKIGEFSFTGSKIKSINIPKDIREIGSYAFYDCKNLSEIYYHTDRPISIYDDIFDTECYTNATLYVPAESINKFKQTAPWKYFSKIQAYEFSSVETVIADSEPPVYFDLQGLRVETPVKGRLYIRLQNGKAEKVFIE